MRVRSRGVLRALAASGALTLVLTALLAACGDRSAVFGAELGDAAPDASHDAQPADVALPDVHHDALPDVPPDLPQDVPVDVPPDVPVFDCPDAGEVPIYALSLNNGSGPSETTLYSFSPSTSTFSPINVIPCLLANIPTAMAVDRSGTVYLTANAALFRVSTTAAHCDPVRWDSPGATEFTMGFAPNGPGPSETLYALSTMLDGQFAPIGLSRIDTSTWFVTPIAPLDWGTITMTRPVDGQLTGSRGGALFGLFFYDEGGGDYPQHLAQIDTTTGQILSWIDARAAFPTPSDYGSLAAWGSNLYLFDANGTVTQYSPTTGAFSFVAALPGANFVAAAASSCALQ